MWTGAHLWNKRREIRWKKSQLRSTVRPNIAISFGGTEMKPVVKLFLLLFLSPLVPISVEAQCETGVSECTQAVPHFVKFNGALRTPAVVPRSGVVAIKFVIYGAATGGTPLWQEVQNTLVDPQGRYEVMLGVTGTEGIPSALFTSGEPRWLGVQALLPGEEEQPRILLVSVPYAVEAQNAQTLAGLPASAFARVATSTSSEAPSGTQTVVTSTGAQGVAATVVDPATSVASVAPTGAIEGRVGPVNVIPKFSGGGLASSQITDAGGTVTMQNLSNTLFADQFSGGVSAAIAACPANGCIIYAVSPAVNLNLGNIDPGFKSITIYLGPYAYTVNQITLRKGLKIIGMGASYGANGSVTCSVAAPCNGTSLRSVNGNNPVFVLPQTNNEPATDVLLSGFILSGSAGNTSEDGFLLDTSATVNTGLWYSILDDIHVSGFAGIGIHVKGRQNDFAATSQWVLFNNVAVFRTAGGGNALRMEGAVFDLRFNDCQFDGQATGDGTNIYIGGYTSGGTGFPTTIAFEGLVSQQAALAVQIDGAVNVTFHASHHEHLSAGYQISDINNIGTRGLTITDSYFAGDTGINGGKGFELSIATTQAFGVVFAHNELLGSPDAVVIGTNFSTPVYRDNWYAGALNGPPTSGITTQVTPAASINIQGAHSIGLNPSTTPITTLQSSLGPGEMVTFFTLGGAVTFGSGGNIDLMGMSSVTVNGTITFVASDLGGSLWKPVSQWSPSAATPQAQTRVINRR
jgi:hypothetical protein